MKWIRLPLIVLPLYVLLIGCNGVELKKAESRTKVNCPGECTGKCEFTIGMYGMKDKDACNGEGGYLAAVLKLYQKPGTGECYADFEREPEEDQGKGLLTWVLCDGTECELTERHFPPGSPTPYGPDDEVPEGKEALSRACYDSFKVEFDMENRTGVYYKFTGGTRKVQSDFDIIARCNCQKEGSDEPESTELTLGVDFTLD